MSNHHGTVAVAKRSLGHFALGRLVSAVVGIATLLLLVRALGRSDYGFYIALLAAFEIAQLAASPGAYAIAFRYLPEVRSAGQGRALGRLVAGLSAYRMLTLALCAALAASLAQPLATLVGAPQQAAAVRLFALVLVFEGMARFIDVQFESLMQQGLAQLSVLTRNVSKLIALVVASDFGSHEVELTHWLSLEAFTSGMGACVSCLLLLSHLRTRWREGPQECSPLSVWRFTRFAVPTYLSQVIYLGSGTEMVKLLVSKLVGTAFTAAFGFAAALAGTIQRYLPSFLLIGWVRPLFITARQQGRPHEELVDLAGTVIKLNLLFLAPIASLLCVAGAEVVQLLAGGRMADSLPYLYFFLVLLVMQTVRALVALLGITLEVGVGSLTATCVSVGGLIAGIMAYPTYGVWALAAGLLLSEALWSVVMAVYLRRLGMHCRLPWLGLVKFIAAATLPWLCIEFILRAAFDQVHPWMVLVGGALAGILCLGLAAALRPFAPQERTLINRLLPARLFIW